MKPVLGVVPDNPPETYGDCFRACVASILEMEADEVPHFLEDGDVYAGYRRFINWLVARGLFCVNAYSIDWPTHIGQDYPDLYYIVGGTSSRDIPHEVVCRGGEVVHNPSGLTSEMQLTKPRKNGMYELFIIGKLP